MSSELARLRLFQLINPTLPIGSFTYSQGMEWAVENNWISNKKTLTDWLDSILCGSLVWLDLPIMLRCRKACEDRQSINFFYWSQYLYASRETHELRQEEMNRARALLAVLKKLPESAQWAQLSTWSDGILKSQAAGFALAAYHWQISERDMLTGFTWSWLENMVTVAIKLVPLGQSDGQAILYQLSEKIPASIGRVMLLRDEDIGASTTALAIASSLHETQYTRFFRS